MNDRKVIYLDDALNALEKVARLFPYKVPGNRDTYDRYNEAWNDAIGRAEIEIENLPSAQAEIIRCGDCKYYKSVLAHCMIRGDKAFLIRGANDYCSRAERRKK